MRVRNVPLFLSILRTVRPERRRTVLLREIGFAYAVLITFLLVGEYLLRFLSLEQQAVSIAGGIVLFLISLRMIFPGEGGLDGRYLLLFGIFTIQDRLWARAGSVHRVQDAGLEQECR